MQCEMVVTVKKMNSSIASYSYHCACMYMCVHVCMCVLRTQNVSYRFQVYTIFCYIYYILHVRSLELIYLTTETWYHLANISLPPPLPIPQAPGKHHSLTL